MALYTKTYRLGAFQDGDIFSPTIDQQRMKIVDQQMEFLSSFIGDGRISGWSISNHSTSADFNFSLSPGSGFINKYASYSYGDIDFSLSNNTTTYIFLQHKNGVVGGFSGLSSYNSVTYTDAVSTANVSNFSIDSYDHDSVNMSWDLNPEPDIDYYLIERSLDNILWAEISRPVSNSYIDTSVLDDTVYYYRIKAVDINGNLSPSYSIPSPAFVLTLKDLSAPANPPFVLAFPQSGQVELVWDAPSSGTVSGYQIDYVRVDSEYNEIGPTESVNTTNHRIVIDELNNDFVYSFSVFSTSEYGVQSEGITVFSSPKLSTGPSEVSALEITDVASTSNETGISLSLSWENALGPYFSPSQKYEITIIENGNIISKSITSTSTSKTIEVFVDTNNISRNIKPRTNYVVLIKGIDLNGLKNNGIVGSITTGNYKSPLSPTNIVAIESINGDISFSWKNSTSVYLYNEILLTSTIGETTSTIESSTNYGRSNSYTILFEDTALSTSYTMKVRSVDEFGNYSSYIETSISTIDQSEINSNPPIPTISEVFSNDKVVVLAIDPNEDESLYIESYKVWRAPFKFNLVPTDFTLIDTISSSNDNFKDYSVSNNTGYYYFLTSVDRFGNESLNPVDDLFISYPLAKAYPHPNVAFDAPGNVSVSSSGYDALISWNPESDSFEGYEIFRSKGDVFNFELAGSVSKEIGYFVDENALLEDGETYYYAIRKYRNEIKLISSSSEDLPDSSVLHSIISITDGNVLITENIQELNNIQISILDNVVDRINNHNHEMTDFFDRRIDLSKNVIIDGWTTSNDLVFSNSQNISSATSFIVRVDGELPSVFYSVNPSDSTITFASKIDGEVTLEAIGIEETTSVIQSERVENVFASQIESGTVLRNQFETYNHKGRLEEDLFPLQFKMTSEDGYKYSILQNKYTSSDSQEVVSSGLTFYDLISVGDISFLNWVLFTYEEWEAFTYDDWFFFGLIDINALVAGTSQGLYVSFDRGESWEELRSTKYLVHDIFYASVISTYFALSGNDIYMSKNGLGWVKMNGLENAAFCKDITEDELGNVYVSTDLGVFKLDQSDLGDQLVWQHAAFTNAESSDCYGIWYDTIGGELVLSNEIGLFSSSDRGITWSVSTVIDEYGPVYQFHEEQKEYSTFIFAVQDGLVWRKNALAENFEVIATLEYEIRNINVFNNRIIINTSDGFLISKESYDPYFDVDISFERLSALNINKNRVDATVVQEVNERLYLGTDGKLFWTSDLETFRKSYEDDTVAFPSVYINGKRKTIGVYYGKNEIFLDVPQLHEQHVYLANQYVGYYAKNNGWIDQNYDAEVKIFQNNNLVASYEAENFELPITQLNNVVFESFTDSTYNVDLANKYSSLYQSELLRLVGIASGDSTLLLEGEEIQSVLANVIKYFYKVYSNKFGNTRFTSTITIDSNEYSIIGNEIVLSSVISKMYPNYNFVPFIDPSISIFQDVVQTDPVNGIFGFVSQLNKYDYLKVNINNAYLYNSGDNTHKEIEDALEIQNTGLAERISSVSSINLIKQGLFIEKTFGKTHSTPVSDCEYAVPRQAVYLLSDSQSWYDTLNSTVDYSEEYSQSELNISISYPIVVEYISSSEQIWVGGLEGMISIDINTDNVQEVDFNDGKESEPVYDIFTSGTSVYVVTQQNVYLTTDSGVTWSSVFTGGVSGKFKKISKIKNNLVLFTSAGIYYKNNSYREWQLSTSDIKSVEFVSNPDLLFAFVDNKLYSSSNGINWNSKTNFEDLDINSISKYRGIFLAATSEGARSDGATFYGNTSSLSLIDIASNSALSETFYINDIDTDSDNQIILVGRNNGDYWIFSSGSWVEYTDSYLDTIHKVLLIDGQPWLFGYNMFKSPNNTIPLRLVEAAPL